MSLPNPGMSFTPFDPLAASELNDLVENVEALADGSGADAASISAAKFTNPYKFSVYRNAAQNTGNGSFGLMAFDTKTFDTGTNFDVVTNNRFTAPVAGFYFFNAHFTSQGAGAPSRNIISLFKNGTEIKRGVDASYGSGAFFAGAVSDIIQLAASDTVDARVYGSASIAYDVSGGAKYNYMSGFLVSAT